MTKKSKKNIKDDYKSSKWLPIFLIALLSIFVVLVNKKLDNDLWYLLTEGRYILKHGIFHTDPFSIHEGLNVVVQNWLSASFLWVVYDFFGEMGILLLIVICNICICILLYKICMLISENNRTISSLFLPLSHLPCLLSFLSNAISYGIFSSKFYQLS